jgi:hypothetical protein
MASEIGKGLCDLSFPSRMCGELSRHIFKSWKAMPAKDLKELIASSRNACGAEHCVPVDLSASVVATELS